MEVASRDFVNGIQTSLKAKSLATVYIRMGLDMWRYITQKRGIASEHKGYTMYQKEDFSRFKDLPSDWYYYLDQHGQGTAIDFPVKAKPVLSWTPARYHSVDGRLEKAKRMPIEKIAVTFARKACDIHSI